VWLAFSSIGVRRDYIDNYRSAVIGMDPGDLGLYAGVSERPRASPVPRQVSAVSRKLHRWMSKDPIAVRRTCDKQATVNQKE